jgi:hypothetical protein
LLPPRKNQKFGLISTIPHKPKKKLKGATMWNSNDMPKWPGASWDHSMVHIFPQPQKHTNTYTNPSSLLPNYHRIFELSSALELNPNFLRTA